jgi:hypothetical protein
MAQYVKVLYSQNCLNLKINIVAQFACGSDPDTANLRLGA